MEERHQGIPHRERLIASLIVCPSYLHEPLVIVNFVDWTLTFLRQEDGAVHYRHVLLTHPRLAARHPALAVDLTDLSCPPRAPLCWAPEMLDLTAAPKSKTRPSSRSQILAISVCDITVLEIPKVDGRPFSRCFDPMIMQNENAEIQRPPTIRRALGHHPRRCRPIQSGPHRQLH
jgi:hypothetical protein